MKKLTITSLFLACFVLTSYSQEQQKEMQRLKATSQNATIQYNAIDSIIKEKNYTRIPNKDFDEIINNKISNSVDDKIHFWLIILGIFLTGVGAISGYAFKKMINQNISEELKKQSNKYVEDYKLYEFDGRLKTIIREFDEFISDKNVSESKKLVSDVEDLLKEIKTLNIKELKINKLLSKTIDQLVYMYYMTFLVDIPKIEELIKSHESICDIPVTAYTNLAILYSSLYATYQDDSYKIQGIAYCEKASAKDPQYGESRGTQLLIYGIDYYNNKRPEAKEAAKAIIQKIIKADSRAYYTVARIDRDRSTNGKYIDNLEKELITEFQVLYTRAKEYEKIINNPII